MMRVSAGLLALAALLAWLNGPVGAHAEKGSELKDTMKKIGDGSSGLYIKLGRELRDDEPVWDDARKMSQELVRLTAGLAKHTPPKGDKASFEKQAKAFATAAAALDQTVSKRDKGTAFAAWKQLDEQNCKACHKAHRNE